MFAERYGFIPFAEHHTGINSWPHGLVHDGLHRRFTEQIRELAAIMDTGLAGPKFKEASSALSHTIELLGNSCTRLGMSQEAIADHFENLLGQVFEALPEATREEVLVHFPSFAAKPPPDVP